MAVDFFVVPTATFGVLFGFMVLAHDRRRVLHFNVTADPTAEWTARQLMQAFPEETAPRFLVRDRDRIYGDRFRRVLEILGVEEIVTAARSPWQNAYAERLIGSLRRECLDQVIVLDEMHLLRILAKYFEYYNETRCHLSLAGDASQSRGAQGPELGEVVELPKVGGLHHRYERAASMRTSSAKPTRVARSSSGRDYRQPQARRCPRATAAPEPHRGTCFCRGRRTPAAPPHRLHGIRRRARTAAERCGEGGRLNRCGSGLLWGFACPVALLA